MYRVRLGRRRFAHFLAATRWGPSGTRRFLEAKAGMASSAELNQKPGSDPSEPPCDFFYLSVPYHQSRSMPMSSNSSISNGQNASSQDITRRAALGAGAVLTAGIMASDHAAFGQQKSDQREDLPDYDPLNPLLKLSFSELRASLNDGTTWLLDHIPDALVRAADLPNFTRRIGLTSPNDPSDKRYVDFAVAPGDATLLIGSFGDGDPLPYVWNATLSVLKFAQLAVPTRYQNGQLVAQDSESILVNGSLHLLYNQFFTTQKNDARYAALADGRTRRSL